MHNRFNYIIKHSWLRDSSQFKTYHEEICYYVSLILYYKLPVPLHSLHTRRPKVMFNNLMKYISIKLYCSLYVIETTLNTISFYKYWLHERVKWGIVIPIKPMSTEAKPVRIYGELNTHKFFTVDIFLEYHPLSSNIAVAKFHHLLGHDFMIQRVTLIFLPNVSQPIRINMNYMKYNIILYLQ